MKDEPDTPLLPHSSPYKSASYVAPHAVFGVSVAQLVASLDPPQPGLLDVLENAGLRTAAALEKMAYSGYIQDEVLGSLLRENRMTRFQYALLKQALRKFFPDSVCV